MMGGAGCLGHGHQDTPGLVENPGLQDHLEHSCYKATSSEQGGVRAVMSFPQGRVSHCWSHFLSPAVLGVISYICIWIYLLFRFLERGL